MLNVAKYVFDCIDMLTYFSDSLSHDVNLSSTMAAMKALLEFIKQSKGMSTNIFQIVSNLILLIFLLQQLGVGKNTYL